MKTTSTTLGRVGWVDLATKAEVTFEEDKTYVIQARGGLIDVSLSDETPEGNNYISIGDGEKFAWTYDGTNTLYVRAIITACTIAIS